jgi:PhoH-like ATPase
MKIQELYVDSDQIATLYERGVISYPRPTGALINSYYVLKSDAGSAHARVTTGNTLTLSKSDKRLTFNKVAPRDAAQKAFFDSLADDNNLLTVGQGRPGSGKTHLTMAWAFDKLFATDNMRLVLTKPNTVVGNTFGFGAVPGDLGEKFKPFLMSYEDTFKDLGLDMRYIEKLIEHGRLDFRPVQYLRGANLRDTILVIDEMQNLSWHELKTILTRAADKSKVIAIGDPSQIDVKMTREETGFHKLVSSKAFAESPVTSWITFEKQYRTALCELVENVDSELTKKRI